MMRGPVRIALIGDYDPEVVAHQAIPMAIALAARASDVQAEPTWVGTDSLAPDVAPQLMPFDGIWCVPASPYANMDCALAAIRFARETGRPFLGTCAGFQHALIEYARNVLDIGEADHAESNPTASVPLIAALSCSLVGSSGAIRLTPASAVAAIYGRDEAIEAYHCSYGVNPNYTGLFDAGDLRVSGRDEAGSMRIVELVSHRFFIATLFQPERSALRGEIHPLIAAFVRATAAWRDGKARTSTPNTVHV